MEARALLESLRRRFFKLARNSKSPIAEAAVRHIAQLYAIEAMVRGSSPDSHAAAKLSQPTTSARGRTRMGGPR